MISHKYLNHGKEFVPIQKCFKTNNFSIKDNKKYIRLYSTTPNSEILSEKFYEDAFLMPKSIIKDNDNKSGIYKWTNKLTNDIYIGQSLPVNNNSSEFTYPLSNKDLNNFYEWFTELTDGEGSFIISKRNDLNFVFSFAITMHIDEKEMLNFIQNTLGVGKVYISGNTAKLNVTKREDIIIIIDIFTKYRLQSIKYLNFLSFKKAFELYISHTRKSPELIKEIANIKANMNQLRTDFSELKDRQISLTPYWVLGFVEGEGSFTIAKRDYTPIFVIGQSGKDLLLMEELKTFFSTLCNKQFEGKYVNEGVNLYKHTKSDMDVIYVSVNREDIITRVIIPFFDSLTWYSKKEKDYLDWKTVLRLKKLGYYTEEGIRVIDLILNQMNLKRLSSSNSISVDRESLDKAIESLFKGSSNVEVLEGGRIFIKSLNRYFNSGARDRIKVEVRDENDLIINTFDSITCAKYYNISRSSLQRKLKNNKLVTINVNNKLYRVLITKGYKEKPTSIYDSENKEDSGSLKANLSNKVNKSRSPFSFFSDLLQADAKNNKNKKEEKREIELMSQSFIYVLEKCSKEGFKVIGSFFSAKKLAHFLGVSTNTIIKYKNSGEIYKDRYRFK